MPPDPLDPTPGRAAPQIWRVRRDPSVAGGWLALIAPPRSPAARRRDRLHAVVALIVIGGAAVILAALWRAFVRGW